MAGVFNGRKNIEFDGTGSQWQPNGNVVVDLGRYRNKRNLATILTITGNIKATVATAPSAETSYNILYKDDHFYNLFSNFQVKLNGNTEVKNVTSLAIFRFMNVLQNRGKFEFRDVPSQITIKANETTGYVPFKLIVTVPFSMFDMIGATQTNICTWLFSSFQMTYKNEVQDVVFKNNIANKSDTPDSNVNGASISIDSAYVNTSAKYWLTSDLVASDPAVYLEQMGNLYTTKVISKGFAGGGKGQYLELTPNLWAKDYIIVIRNSETNERIDGIVDRIKIADGNNILVDTTPEILKNDMMTRFSLSQALFSEKLADSPDNKGIFYGVYHIGTNYFGDMNNSLVFISWNQPRLTIDFNDNFSNVIKSGQEVLVEVYQNYEEQPQLLQQVATAEANRLATAQG